MNTQQLSDFLKKAKKNTYASQQAKKVPPTRLNSKDYEYAEGSLVYHDTYFGRRYFIGEEVVYENERPLWGMNYNGYLLDPKLTEEDIDKSLRAALWQDCGDLIPVRGPARYVAGNYEYTNVVTGDLSCFQGREEIKRDGELVYYAVFHGGNIE